MSNLKNLFLLQGFIREFFKNSKFLEVMTPPLVQCAGIEPHIHTLSVTSNYPNKNKVVGQLHTSPEFWMKYLLSEKFDKIFTLSYCFRDEPNSTTHRNQFVMLEWYRQNSTYFNILDDSVSLISYCYEKFKNQIPKKIKLSVQELFITELNINILDLLEVSKLKQVLKDNFPELYQEEINEWEDLFYIIFLNKLEPLFKEKYPFLILTDFPSPLAALSKIDTDDNRICNRFEIYLHGIEICNCYQELTNLEEQQIRYQQSKELKTKVYGVDIPIPKVLFKSLEKGIGSPAGIALGVERLLMSITQDENCFFPSIK